MTSNFRQNSLGNNLSPKLSRRLKQVQPENGEDDFQEDRLSRGDYTNSKSGLTKRNEKKKGSLLARPLSAQSKNKDKQVVESQSESRMKQASTPQ